MAHFFIWILFLLRGIGGIGFCDNVNKTYNISHLQSGYTLFKDIANIIINTRGNPVNWHMLNDLGDAEYVGFSAGGTSLSGKKLERIRLLGDEEIYELLSLGRYEIHFTLTDLSNDSLPVIYELGQDLDLPAVVSTRYAMLNDSLVRADLKLMGDLR